MVSPFSCFKFESNDKAREILSHWNPVWVEENPDDPLSYILLRFPQPGTALGLGEAGTTATHHPQGAQNLFRA